jgi:hypothetical protein
MLNNDKLPDSSLLGVFLLHPANILSDVLHTGRVVIIEPVALTVCFGHIQQNPGIFTKFNSTCIEPRKGNAQVLVHVDYLLGGLVAL